MINPGRDLLSHLVFVTKYAGTSPDGTRETQAHAVERVCDMHRKKVSRNNKITDANKALLYAEIDECERLLKDRVISPSMRSFQFAGRGIERSHARGYNCAYAPLDDHRAFGELMYLLMNGCGVGFSCERAAIAAIPPVYPGSPVLFQVADTKEAWADSIIALMENPDTIFDYTKVRPEGAPLSTGGTASGPGPLRKAHNAIKAILRGRLHQRLRSVDVFDVACHVAAAVHCGGVRRSAMIAIFDKDDEEMMTAKSGDWYIHNPQRSQANISARLLPGESPTPLMLRMFENGSGEPGIFRAANATCGTNPCVELSLWPRQFCNLTSLNTPALDFGNEWAAGGAYDVADAAAALGTLQASYTDFTYLRPEWRRVTEQESLIGVSLNGLADCDVTPHQLRTLAQAAVDANRRVSKLLGINPAARVTTVKPEGTNSLYLGCSPGIHSGGAYGTHYWRRMTFGKSESITAVLRDAFKHAPWEAIEQNMYGGQEDKVFLKVPVIAPAGKKETALEFLERVKVVQQNWVKPGSEGSELTNNVSATCTYTEAEKAGIVDWLETHKDNIGSLSFLPSDTHTYAQPIYEPRDPDATAVADIWLAQNIDAIHAAIDAAKLGDVDLQAEMACAGGACEVK